MTGTKNYKKLVRDRIPEVIQRNGDYPNFSQVTNLQELIVHLSDKLVEEAEELQQAFKTKTDSKVIEELADVLEVTEALIERLDEAGIPMAEIYRCQKQKRKYKGSFERGIWLESVSCKKD